MENNALYITNNSVKIKIVNKITKLKAFTLAEVLITLMVIGILAIITIPGFLQSWQEIETVTKLRKIYSIMQEAYKLAEVENGTPDTWNLSYSNPLGYMINHLNIIKECPGNTAGCSYMGIYKYLNGNDYLSNSNILSGKKFMLSDNTVITPLFLSSNCSSAGKVNGNTACDWIYIDINGLKAPNQWGKDLFVFSITKAGIFPWGGPNDGTNFYPTVGSCNISFDGYGCARWVIERGNMDYLHKNITSW